MPSQVFHVEPPVQGLNARDAIDGLTPNEAIELSNWIPDVGFMRSRRGHVLIASLPIDEPVETLIPFEDDGEGVLLAVADGRIFNVSDTQNVFELTLPNGQLPTSRVQHTVFTDLNGNQRVVITPSSKSESTFTPIEYNAGTDAIAEMVFTGIPDPAVLIEPVNFKGRIVFGDRTQLSAWYTQAGSLAGELTELPLGSVFQRGGGMRHVFTWSKDTGAGMDDMLGVMANTGETIIYQGDDPDDALGWEMVQRYNLPRPLDAETERMASEVLYISEDGYVNLSQAISEGQVSDYAMFSGKIARLVKNAVLRYRQNPGWQIIFYPRGNMVIANIPQQTNRQFTQHVMNTRNGAWTTFKGMNASALCVWNGRLIFGSASGDIFWADRGSSDNGEPISCTCVTAFSDLGIKNGMKNVKAMSVLHNHGYPEAFNLDCIVDFKAINLPPVTGIDERNVGQWNVSNWDEDYWGVEETPYGGTRWRRPLRGNGFNIAFAVRQASAAQIVYWFSSTIEFTVTGRK